LLLCCRGGLLPKLLLAAAVVGAGAFAYKTYQEKADEKKADDGKKAKGGWGKK
jgi:hypothetical protein